MEDICLTTEQRQQLRDFIRGQELTKKEKMKWTVLRDVWADAIGY
jgi:Spy/CpxP family protein refolding chaperone